MPELHQLWPGDHSQGPLFRIYNTPQGRPRAGAITMSVGHVLRAHRLTVAGLTALTLVAGTCVPGAWDSAEARPRQRAQKQTEKQVTPRTDFGPRYADIVVDTNSGEALHEAKPDELRHPASLTKIMTLYLLFEQLEAGKVKLDMPLPVSA